MRGTSGGSSRVSEESPPSPLDGIGSNLLVGWDDFVFCADTRVSEGPLACGLLDTGFFFFEALSELYCSLYCIPVLARRGIRLVLVQGLRV